jgi:hypothetical protein
MVVDSICPFCCAQPRRDSWLLGLLLDQQLNSFGKEVQPAGGMRTSARHWITPPRRSTIRC